jgi:hypothetical protein
VSSTIDGSSTVRGVSRRARWMRFAIGRRPHRRLPWCHLCRCRWQPAAHRGIIACGARRRESAAPIIPASLPSLARANRAYRSVPATGQLATERGKRGVDQQTPGLGPSRQAGDQLRSALASAGPRGSPVSDPIHTRSPSRRPRTDPALTSVAGWDRGGLSAQLAGPGSAASLRPPLARPTPLPSAGRPTPASVPVRRPRRPVRVCWL